MQAVMVTNGAGESTVQCAGQIALYPNGTMVGDDIKAQTEQALTNIQAILKAAGTSMANV
jgi:2-iminobutanoate/2-iminopropanoate deaminase